MTPCCFVILGIFEFKLPKNYLEEYVRGLVDPTKRCRTRQRIREPT
jgi:hypothetical protein